MKYYYFQSVLKLVISFRIRGGIS